MCYGKPQQESDLEKKKFIEMKKISNSWDELMF